MPQLEDFIVEQLMKENMKIKLRDDYNIVGKWCRCVNESSKFDKIKNKLLPGIWKVVDTEDGLFVLNENNNKTYYYRGSQTNNYVYFADQLWRIVSVDNKKQVKFFYFNLFTSILIFLLIQQVSQLEKSGFYVLQKI